MTTRFSLEPRGQVSTALRATFLGNNDEHVCVACPPAEDVDALLSVLQATPNALVASHILHLLHRCLARQDPPELTPEQMQREPG
jgi:hypothetical protein